MVCFSTIEQTSEVLQKIYTNKMYTDITLVAGKDGKKIQAHKVVLTAALEYFELMLSGSFKEATDPEVKIENIDADILEAVIKFMYLGLVEIQDMKTAIELFEVSHLMKIPALQDHAESYMIENIAPDNCLGLISLARKYEVTKLASKSEYFAVRELEHVIKGEEFKNLYKEEMVYYMTLLKNITNEDCLTRAVLNFLDLDESRRNLCFKDLLRLIDVNLIEDKELVLSLYSTCIDSEDTKYMVESLYNNPTDKTNNLLNSNPDIILLVEYLANDTKILYFYNFVKDEFVGYSKIKEGGRVVGIWQGKIVIINSEGDDRTVKTYDLDKNLITIIGTYRLKDILFSKTKIHKGYLYLFVHRSYLQVDLKTGVFKNINSEDGFSFESCVIFKSQLYCLVYSRTDTKTSWLTKYENIWKRYANFQNTNKKLGRLVIHDHTIYYFYHNIVFVYNADEDKWTEQPQYEFSSVPQLISIHSKLLVIDDKKIFEYSEGTIKPFDSKLNMLDWKSGLTVYSCS